MRLSVPGIATLLLLTALPLFAVSPTVVDDVIRMARAGVPDDTIVAFVHARDDAFDLSADDIIAMKSAGVSSTVIQAVIDEAAARNPQPPTEPAQTPPPQETQPAEQPDSGTNVVIATAPIPDYLWDPWWYMPKLDTKSGSPAKTPEAKPAAAPDTRRSPKHIETYRPETPSRGGSSFGGRGR